MHNSPAGGNIPVMSPRLRTLIDLVSASADPDAVLLRRFAHTRDPQAFAELVRRYGRLVWGQCRHLLPTEEDADDAFQATFLTLAKSAHTLRDTNKLGPWLHGVAYRVCQQSKRAAGRRNKREKATAKAEATKPVADSAWDQAFSTVHDELAQLPDTLRVPFVLCVLEGKGLTEAANQLGLKVGTLSSRLSRAKQALLERLSARGLTAGLAVVGAAAVGATNAPAAVMGRACDFAAGGPVPADILSLSSGVMQMVTMNAKRWAMAAVLTCGLAAGGAGVWQANAQDKKPEPKPKTTAADDDLKRLQAEAELKKFDAMRAEEQLRKAQADLEAANQLLAARAKKGDVAPEPKQQAAPEFLYLGQAAEYAPTAEELEKTVKGVEAKGYTFVGVVSMKGQSKARFDIPVPTLVFRRGHGGHPAPSTAKEKLGLFTEKKVETDKQTNRERELQDQIEQLNKQLADLKGKGGAKGQGGPRLSLDMRQVGGDSTSGSAFVTQLVRLKYGEKVAGGLSFTPTKDLLVVEGLNKEQAVWLLDTVNGIAFDAPKSSPK